MEDVFVFAKKEHKRQIEHYGIKDSKDANYVMLAKLMEEVGELSEAMLATDSLQRGDKLRDKEINLAGEFADVLLITLILAEQWNVDIRKSLQQKIDTIKKRSYV